MKSILAAVSLFLGATMASAQDGVFESYADYEAFVNSHMMSREFATATMRLGGRDEITPEKMASIEQQLLGIFQRDFTNKTVFKTVMLDGGVRQEGRMYWQGTSYLFLYALLHEHETGLAVLEFHYSTKAGKITGKF
ncbi:hypothetical protein [Shimia sp. Alg240-R146]|uniref:hypothetical protein n=1 Tax=Shimia sp. Alg240-R146 TaxID=2993449 RepID=UPI0022DF2ABF|nr:hypothetical protein [Shimia sp. Alg240-R146]